MTKTLVVVCYSAPHNKPKSGFESRCLVKRFDDFTKTGHVSQPNSHTLLSINIKVSFAGWAQTSVAER